MNFKIYREKARLTQREVAENLKISHTTVSMWETGKSYPRSEMLLKIAELYKCSVEELLKSESGEQFTA